MPDQPVAAPPEVSAGARRDRTTALRRIVTGRPVRWGFVAATIGLGGWAVAREWSGVRTALVDIGPLAAIAALGAVLVAMVAAMQIWRVLLAALGSPLPVRAAARVVFVGQLGKYLPGSVWPVLAQMELATAHHVPRTRSATASVLTMLVSLLGGLLTALFTLPFVIGRSGGPTPYLWTFVAAPVILAALHPRILNPILTALLKLARRPPLERPLTGRAISVALAWSLVSWVLYGLQIWLLATRIGVTDGSSTGTVLLLAAGGFAFAWSVGFLVVFAPAGAGVREVLLVALLGPVLGTGGATAIALVSRVLMTVGDLATAAVSAWHRPTE
ncbi:MAG TPA: lysylphosphatidylglycerol synthase transmembrane domain-containing protein [Pseudonocardiaceae bacterium]|jgi:hypothetical protein|nr:lysylphosphatidylglycerol synthase transmembrane domain-containing protein [Pseudonocardiaceae bacterium]